MAGPEGQDRAAGVVAWRWRAGAVLFVVLLAASTLVPHFLGPPRRASTNFPLVGGHREGCLSCHGQVQGLTGAHDPRAIGCAACHRGDALAEGADAAHRGMVVVPGNLDGVALTCGRAGCHPALAARVRASPMAAARGLIAVDRWAFGEQPTPDGTATPAQLGGSPADRHLAELCMSCHLGAAKLRPAPIGELSRGGGCLACHLRDDPPRTPAHDAPASFVHPGLSLRVHDGSCFGCHSRSGRISLSYAGWREAPEPAAATPGPAASAPGPAASAPGPAASAPGPAASAPGPTASAPGPTASAPGPAASAPGPAAAAPVAADVRRLADGRLLLRAAEDVHHQRGLGCIDCHTARELMGDGPAPAHEEQATRVRCTTCHRTSPPRSVARADLDEEAALIVGLRGGAASAAFLVEDQSGEALTGASPRPDGAVEVRGKLDGRVHVAVRPSPACALAGHQRLSCQACHSAWAPRCVGCHTERAAAGGPWVEYDVAPAIAPPTLGLLERGGRTAIEPFVPGMVLTIDGQAPPTGAGPGPRAARVAASARFLRAYAFAVPHTTTRAGRSCVSCHLDPVALGFGAGRLVLDGRGGRSAFRFEPAFAASPFDGLPADAWVAFAGAPSAGRATRTQAAPLDRATLRRLLAAGACMTCHDPARSDGARLFADFKSGLARRTDRCRTTAE